MLLSIGASGSAMTRFEGQMWPDADSAWQSALHRATDPDAYRPSQLAAASQWVVGLDDDEPLSTLAAGGQLQPTGPIPNTYVWQLASETDPSAAAQQLAALDGVAFSYPLVELQRDARAVPNDPLFGNQWHLRNTGQTGGTPGEDVNAVAAWDSVTGDGVVIGIVDDGLQHTHPDLHDQYRADLSWDFNFDDPDPTPGALDDHGTATAGVAGA